MLQTEDSNSMCWIMAAWSVAVFFVCLFLFVCFYTLYDFIQLLINCFIVHVVCASVCHFLQKKILWTLNEN